LTSFLFFAILNDCYRDPSPAKGGVRMTGGKYGY